MIRPTPEQLSGLSPFERFAFKVADSVNESKVGKKVAQGLMHHLSATWMGAATKNLLRLHGFEQVKTLEPPGGVMIISNHRSFFDMYVVAMAVHRETTWYERLYFPVRADFFYESPAGMFVNFAMSGFAIYPPVMRAPSKRSFNRFTVEKLTELLQQKGTVVGIHPEGTRNKSADPYALLPAQTGAGEIAWHAKPTILPFFVNGLRVDGLGKQVKGNYDGTGDPIWVVAGPPMDLSAFHGKPGKLRTYKEMSDVMLAEIRRLGELEKQLRAGG